jgi:hypothetical protein
VKPLFALFIGFVVLSIPTAAQEKNDVGLNIGATLTPSQSLVPGASLIGPSGNVLRNRSLNFDSSLALGAEYDHRIVSGNRAALYAGIDFLASPNDVQLSQLTQNAPKSYAYIFLTPHFRVKLNPRGALSPWLEFGGGVTRGSCQPYLRRRPRLNAVKTPAHSSLVAVFREPLLAADAPVASSSVTPSTSPLVIFDSFMFIFLFLSSPR